MEKQTAKALGLLIFDVILVCALVYGGFFGGLALAWIWLTSLVIAYAFISGEALKVEIRAKSLSERALLYTGSAINISGLFVTGHYITLVAYLVGTAAIVIFRTSRGELNGN